MIDSSKFAVIGAHTDCLAFGLGDGMPWPKGSLKEDIQHFRSTTTLSPSGKKNLLVVGRATFEAMGSKALPNRYMAVISSKFDTPQKIEGDVFGAKSIPSLLLWLDKNTDDINSVFFIGGEQIWKEAMSISYSAHITLVHRSIQNCDGISRLRTSLTRQAILSGLIRSNEVKFITSNWGGEIVQIAIYRYFRPFTFQWV